MLPLDPVMQPAPAAHNRLPAPQTSTPLSPAGASASPSCRSARCAQTAAAAAGCRAPARCSQAPAPPPPLHRQQQGAGMCVGTRITSRLATTASLVVPGLAHPKVAHAFTQPARPPALFVAATQPPISCVAATAHPASHPHSPGSRSSARSHTASWLSAEVVASMDDS